MKNLNNFPAGSRSFSSFVHGFVHGRGNRQLFESVGLGPKNEPRIWTTFEDQTSWIGWRGHNGQWYKHPLPKDRACGWDEESFNALAVKVRLSTC